MPGTWRECRAATDSEVTSWRCLTDIRFTHVGGRAALIEVGGWRLLTDPTFDSPAGGTPSAGGRSRARLRGPAAADIGPIDAVLLSHDHRADNLDDAGRAFAALGQCRADHRCGCETVGRQCVRVVAVVEPPTGGAGSADDRGHRDTVPARSAAHRLRPALGGSGIRCAVGFPAKDGGGFSNTRDLDGTSHWTTPLGRPPHSVWHLINPEPNPDQDQDQDQDQDEPDWADRFPREPTATAAPAPAPAGPPDTCPDESESDDDVPPPF
jgi:hypothetical protein